MSQPGYEDTPHLPGGQWRVHDPHRPHPPVVVPPTPANDAGPGRPPSDATVLFDGANLDAWVGRSGGPAEWRLVAGQAMEVAPGTGDIRTKEDFAACQLHLEWRAPAKVLGDSQGRGNSGVFLLGRYEVQVLDGYDNPTYADGAAAAIYGQHPPLANACVPPGVWHAYDIAFEPPIYRRGTLVKPAFMTVIHNGLVVQHRRELQGPTQHRALASYAEPHGPAGPVLLQDHGDRVQFRNIWIRVLATAD